MNQFQPVKFKSIDDFFSFLPTGELKIVKTLREIIFNSIPICKEKLAYNVPYYYQYSRVCFIWPSSIPWGKVKTEGVKFGFCQGYLLSDELNYLEKENRKQVYTKTFMHIKEIKVEVLKSYIFQAIEIDEENHQKKKSKK